MAAETEGSEAKFEIEVATDEDLVMAMSGIGGHLRRGVEEVFAVNQQEAHEKTMKVYGSKIGKVEGFEKVLSLVGSGCGYCFSQGLILPETHGGENCISMSRAQQQEFKQLKRAVTYTPSGSSKNVGSACWRCHVNSMGHNALHPQLVKGSNTCKNKNMMLPFVYGVFAEKEFRELAMSEVVSDRSDWGSIEKFGRWLVVQDKEYGTKAMAVLGWYIKYKRLA